MSQVSFHEFWAKSRTQGNLAVRLYIQTTMTWPFRVTEEILGNTRVCCFKVSFYLALSVLTNPASTFMQSRAQWCRATPAMDHLSLVTSYLCVIRHRSAHHSGVWTLDLFYSCKLLAKTKHLRYTARRKVRVGPHSLPHSMKWGLKGAQT